MVHLITIPRISFLTSICFLFSRPSEVEDDSTATPCKATTEENILSVSSLTAQTPCTPPSLEIKNSVAKPFTTPSKLNTVEVSNDSKNVANLPTFTPSLYPPSAFNYERPSYFIQSQSNTKFADNVQVNRDTKASPPPSTSSWLISSKSTPSSSQSISPFKCASEAAYSTVSNTQLGDRTSQTINVFPTPRQHSPSQRFSPVSPDCVPKQTALTCQISCNTPVSSLQVSACPALSSTSPSLPTTMSPPKQKSYISLPVGNNQGTPNV